MAAWSWLIMFVLVIAIIAVAVLTFLTEMDNKKRQQANILYPFNGQLTPPNGFWTVNSSNISNGAASTPQGGMSLLGAKGGKSADEPQIQCPAGYKVNIVGAFLDVIDPYGECSGKPNSILQATCGTGFDLSAAASCSSTNDCGIGLECISNKCVPMTCTDNSKCAGIRGGGDGGTVEIKACPVDVGKTCKHDGHCSDGTTCINGTCQADPGQGACMACVKGYCSAMPICNFTDNGLNTTCSATAGKDFKCRPRDASAYLAAHCDGKGTCLGPEDPWLPNTKGGAFGPLPCQIHALSTDSDYSSLPIITGWGGGKPNNATKDSEATFSQGYYVHGIFSCVPDEESSWFNWL